MNHFIKCGLDNNLVTQFMIHFFGFSQYDLKEHDPFHFR
jgi:hypothetical protein